MYSQPISRGCPPASRRAPRFSEKNHRNSITKGVSRCTTCRRVLKQGVCVAVGHAKHGVCLLRRLPGPQQRGKDEQGKAGHAAAGLAPYKEQTTWSGGTFRSPRPGGRGPRQPGSRPIKNKPLGAGGTFRSPRPGGRGPRQPGSRPIKNKPLGAGGTFRSPRPGGRGPRRPGSRFGQKRAFVFFCCYWCHSRPS